MKFLTFGDRQPLNGGAFKIEVRRTHNRIGDIEFTSLGDGWWHQDIDIGLVPAELEQIFAFMRGVKDDVKTKGSR